MQRALVRHFAPTFTFSMCDHKCVELCGSDNNTVKSICLTSVTEYVFGLCVLVHHIQFIVRFWSNKLFA